jgi:hypothetical protein
MKYYILNYANLIDLLDTGNRRKNMSLIDILDSFLKDKQQVELVGSKYITALELMSEDLIEPFKKYNGKNINIYIQEVKND